MVQAVDGETDKGEKTPMKEPDYIMEKCNRGLIVLHNEEDSWEFIGRIRGTIVCHNRENFGDRGD